MALLRGSSWRPVTVFIAVVLGLIAIDGGNGNILSMATAFSSLQYFATLGLVALGLALTMLIGEFDLSVGGLFGLGGCVAVIAGNSDPLAGIAAALAIGLVFGLVQGLIITRFRLNSVAVTLGGLLTANGLAYVITLNRTISFDDIDLALALNEPIATIFSPRSLAVIAFFIVSIVIFATTRIGRDLVATGSDRRAALVSGVGVDRVLIGSFAVSASLSALGGALLSYGLASASPAGLTDILVPAIAAAILGGVSLSGGVGGPLGLAIGVLTLSLLRTGLNALGVPPFVNGIASGAVLLAVAIMDAPRPLWRQRLLRSRFRSGDQ